MNLATYRSSQYTSAIQASQEGGIHNLCTLYQNPTIEMLGNVGELMASDFHIAIESAISTFNCVGEESYVFIITDDNTPKFELDDKNDSWNEVEKTLDAIIGEECNEAIEHLKSSKFIIYVSETLTGNLINLIDDCGNVESLHTQSDDEGSVTINGMSFDYKISYYSDTPLVDFFNLISDSIGDVKTNYDFDYQIECKSITLDEMNLHLSNAKQNKLIDTQLKNIEKWSSSAYMGPCDETNGEGDEIWKALFQIRKIINIGDSEYTKELNSYKKS